MSFLRRRAFVVSECLDKLQVRPQANGSAGAKQRHLRSGGGCDSTPREPRRLGKGPMRAAILTRAVHAGA